MLKEAYPKTVKLKDGQSIVIRPLARDDFEQLHRFFKALPEEDRVFLRHDVRDPEMVRKWTEELDFDRVIPLVALDGDEIVASGSLHIMNHGWSHVRLVAARARRHNGLGGLMVWELVALAAHRGLEKLQAHIIEENVQGIKMCERVGFKKVAALEGVVMDQTGRERNLVMMVNSVAELSRIMEDWIQGMMIPSYRVPGDGA